MVIQGDRLREYSRGSLWFLPAVAAVLGIMLGAVLSRINVGPNSILAFQGTADDARSLLITISGTMITVIALLLGLTVVALQLSSTQFSPRLLRNFLRDRSNQLVLGVFVGTFTYSAAGLFQVGVSGGMRVDEFPRFAVTTAIVLLFLSLALLVFFADHLAHSLQVDHIMRVVERNTLQVIRDLPSTGEQITVPAEASTIASHTSGYVQVVHIDELLATAVRHRVNIRLRPRIGEHVVTGSTLAWVWKVEGSGVGPAGRLGTAVESAVRIGFERTLEQDPGLGMRQLCDAACKALSPAVNDPYTAVQAIDHLSVLYSALAAHRIGNMIIRDPAQAVVVAIPGRSLADHVFMGLGLIRRYGASEPTVVHALLRLLSTVLSVLARRGANPADLQMIEDQMQLLVRAAQREVAEPADLVIVDSEVQALRRALENCRAGVTSPPD